jgi:hypothetical protein
MAFLFRCGGTTAPLKIGFMCAVWSGRKTKFRIAIADPKGAVNHDAALFMQNKL